MSDKEPIPTSEYCIHGKLYGNCNPCDLAAELAYDEFCKEPNLLIIDERPTPPPTDSTITSITSHSNGINSLAHPITQK